MAIAVHAQDEIFWKQIREAADRVAINNKVEITVAVADQKAEVFTSEGLVVIELSEYEPPKPVLIVPAGQGQGDD